MSEQAEAKLKAADIYRMLDHLSVYAGSSHAQVVPQKGAPDSCGNYIYLDGDEFLKGFASYLRDFELEEEKILGDLCLTMEISIYVRNGGVRAIMYRLEKGGANLLHDYFDAIARPLARKYQDGKFVPVLEEGNANLISRLRQINSEDEVRVSNAISEVDQVLLDLSRKLEDKSDERLEEKKESSAE